MNIKKVLTRF